MRTASKCNLSVIMTLQAGNEKWHTTPTAARCYSDNVIPFHSNSISKEFIVPSPLVKFVVVIERPREPHVKPTCRFFVVSLNCDT